MTDRELAGWIAGIALVVVLLLVFGAGTYVTGLFKQLAAGFGQ